MKILEIVGARPQFIKAGVVSKLFRREQSITDIILHTGQHYDENMSKIFFDELEIPKPSYNLNVGSGTHGKQTALMLEGIEKVLIEEKPDWVLVYGDTNSTVAGSLAASKLHIKVAHIEAGLRSFNREMPEEINRITTDHISDVLFAPTINAINLLEKEGLKNRSHFSGDVMFDSVLHYQNVAEEKYKLKNITSLENYYLATVHRQENTDDKNKLQNLFTAFSNLDLPVLIPLHPRTKKLITNIKFNDNIKVIDPVSYLEMLLLLKNSKKVFTDSGGLQKEAYFLKKPCITLRNETEWIETLENNWNFIVGTDVDLILEKSKEQPSENQKNSFGDGKAGEKIVNFIKHS
ncbi:MAG: UDP-N-acetylglucosamine 2-epimerase (non-hydrolyzing) [Ignavibacteriales bacterium]|nr:UDP-N-acetylglucosamine 2-epimerase (non-hydrolyzing) [Ignavibacteriota bacterium]MCB9248546.1 UDP-N-acetylglucosamine 2-epimerase (non-hydrolyzing) [Ignavibacteriales bacterium]